MAGTTFETIPTICISLANEGKTQVGWANIVGWKMWRCVKVNNTLPTRSPCHVWDLIKWLWDPNVKKHARNIVGMGMDIIVRQMGKVDPRYC